MRKLIKVAMIVAGVVAMLSFAGCGESNNASVTVAKPSAPKSQSSVSTPDQLALQVIGKLAAGQADDSYLKKVCTERSSASMMMVRDELAKVMKGARFEVVDTKESGDKAVVKIKQVGGIDGNGTIEDFNLVKVDGVWKYDNF